MAETNMTLSNYGQRHSSTQQPNQQYLDNQSQFDIGRFPNPQNSGIPSLLGMPRPPPQQNMTRPPPPRNMTRPPPPRNMTRPPPPRNMTRPPPPRNMTRPPPPLRGNYMDNAQGFPFSPRGRGGQQYGNPRQPYHPQNQGPRWFRGEVNYSPDQYPTPFNDRQLESTQWSMPNLNLTEQAPRPKSSKQRGKNKKENPQKVSTEETESQSVTKLSENLDRLQKLACVEVEVRSNEQTPDKRKRIRNRNRNRNRSREKENDKSDDSSVYNDDSASMFRDSNRGRGNIDRGSRRGQRGQQGQRGHRSTRGHEGHANYGRSEVDDDGALSDTCSEQSESSSTTSSRGRRGDRGRGMGRGRGDRGRGQSRRGGHRNDSEGSEHSQVSDVYVYDKAGVRNERIKKKREKKSGEPSTKLRPDLDALVDENKVFQALLLMAKDDDLDMKSIRVKLNESGVVPKKVSVVKWFLGHKRRFLQFSKDQHLLYIFPFFKGISICLNYNGLFGRGNLCKKSDCGHVHICRNLLSGTCRFGRGCRLYHSIKGSCKTNDNIIRKVGLESYTEEALQTILLFRYPQICKKFLEGMGDCSRDESCPYLHVCPGFLKGRCLEVDCKMIHNLSSEHNKWVLTVYNLTSWLSERMKFLKKTIMVDYGLWKDGNNDDENESVCDDESVIDEDEFDDDKESDQSSTDISDEEEDDEEEEEDVKENKHIEKDEERGSLKAKPKPRKPIDRAHRFDNMDYDDFLIADVQDPNEHLAIDLSTQDIGYTESMGARPKLNQEENKKTKSMKIKNDKAEKVVDEKSDADRKLTQVKKSTNKKESNASTEKGSLTPSSVEDKTVPKQTTTNTPMTWLEEDADTKPICHKYIEGTCQGCTKGHHIPVEFSVPYLWQIKIQEGPWRNFKDSDENEYLEKEYCNLEEVVDIEVKEERCIYNIHVRMGTTLLDGIIYECDGLDHQPESCQIRRLSTPSYAETKSTIPSANTQWRWFWRDDSSSWILYDKDSQQRTLETKYNYGKQQKYMFFRDNYNFKNTIDFRTFKQVNLDTQKKREICRRPLFVSKKDVKCKQFANSLDAIPVPPKPPHFAPWDMSCDFELIELGTVDKERQSVCESFYKTVDKSKVQMKLVYRIQNRKLHKEYETKKKNMLDDLKLEGQSPEDINERHLFHGTDSENVCRGICTNSFDFRTSGKNATVFGEGSYFAVTAKYSHSYTKSDGVGMRYMFQAKVLTGCSTKGQSSYRRPPERPGQAHRLFDSCVDDELGPNMYIIFNQNQAYPEYLMAYTQVVDTLPTKRPAPPLPANVPQLSTYTKSQPNIAMTTQSQPNIAMATQHSYYTNYTPGATASGHGQVNPNLTSPTSPTKTLGSVLDPLRYPATSSQSNNAGTPVYQTTPSSDTRSAQPTQSASAKTKQESCVVQ